VKHNFKFLYPTQGNSFVFGDQVTVEIRGQPGVEVAWGAIDQRTVEDVNSVET